MVSHQHGKYKPKLFQWDPPKRRTNLFLALIQILTQFYGWLLKIACVFSRFGTGYFHSIAIIDQQHIFSWIYTKLSAWYLKIFSRPGWRLIYLFLLLSLSLPARADSPVTSTVFSEAYLDLPLVQEATQSHVLSAAMTEFLSNPLNPIDHKLALVNALGWNINGQKNHLRWLAHLRQRYQQPEASIEELPLTGEEKLILGYLMVLDDYFQPRNGLIWIRRGARQLWQSQIAQMILAIAEAQEYINRPKIWCQIWLQFQQTLNNPDLQMDLRPAAQTIIKNYLELYRPECKGRN